jgi:hypothetical protein
MDKYPREASPRELTDREIEAVSGGAVPADPGLGGLTAFEAHPCVCPVPIIPPAGTPGFGQITAAGH